MPTSDVTMHSSLLRTSDNVARNLLRWCLWLFVFAVGNHKFPETSRAVARRPLPFAAYSLLVVVSRGRRVFVTRTFGRSSLDVKHTGSFVLHDHKWMLIQNGEWPSGAQTGYIAFATPYLQSRPSGWSRMSAAFQVTLSLLRYLPDTLGGSSQSQQIAVGVEHGIASSVSQRFG